MTDERPSLQLTAANPLVWVVAMALMAAFVAYGRYALRSPAGAGSQLVDESGQTLDDIVESIKKVSDIVAKSRRLNELIAQQPSLESSASVCRQCWARRNSP